MATCKDGSPCHNWATRGSDPPRCGAHSGGLRAPADRRCNATCKDGALRLHGQSTGRLSKLLRDQRKLAEETYPLQDAIHQALDELSEEWGVDL